MGLNYNADYSTKLHVLTQPKIGLKRDLRHSIVETFNNPPADVAFKIPGTRSALWNGPKAGFYDWQLMDRFKNLPQNNRQDKPPEDVADIIDLEAAVRFLREDDRKGIVESGDGALLHPW